MVILYRIALSVPASDTSPDLDVVDPQKKVCKQSAKSLHFMTKKSAKSSPDADFADLCRLLKKSARVCPPMIGIPSHGSYLLPVLCYTHCYGCCSHRQTGLRVDALLNGPLDPKLLSTSGVSVDLHGITLSMYMLAGMLAPSSLSGTLPSACPGGLAVSCCPYTCPNLTHKPEILFTKGIP